MSPFKSEAQRAFMYAHNPTLAKEFESKTPKGVHLPKRKKKNAKKRIKTSR